MWCGVAPCRSVGSRAEQAAAYWWRWDVACGGARVQMRIGWRRRRRHRPSWRPCPRSPTEGQDGHRGLNITSDSFGGAASPSFGGAASRRHPAYSLARLRHCPSSAIDHQSQPRRPFARQDLDAGSLVCVNCRLCLFLHGGASLLIITKLPC